MARPRSGREDQVLAAFEAYVGRHGRPPSMRELADLCGFSGVSGIYRYLSRLRAEGRITWETNLSRTMRAVHEQAEDSGV